MKTEEFKKMLFADGDIKSKVSRNGFVILNADLTVGSPLDFVVTGGRTLVLMARGAALKNVNAVSAKYFLKWFEDESNTRNYSEIVFEKASKVYKTAFALNVSKSGGIVLILK